MMKIAWTRSHQTPIVDGKVDKLSYGNQLPFPERPKSNPTSSSTATSTVSHECQAAVSESNNESEKLGSRDLPQPKAKHKVAKKGKPLQELAEEKLIDQLKDSVDGYQARASYCCGGSIPTSANMDSAQSTLVDPESSKHPATAPPEVLRWDLPKEEYIARKIQFPLVAKKSINTRGSKAKETSILDKLLDACSKATLGVKARMSWMKDIARP